MQNLYIKTYKNRRKGLNVFSFFITCFNKKREYIECERVKSMIEIGENVLLEYIEENELKRQKQGGQHRKQ